VLEGLPGRHPRRRAEARPAGPGGRGGDVPPGAAAGAGERPAAEPGQDPPPAGPDRGAAAAPAQRGGVGGRARCAQTADRELHRGHAGFRGRGRSGGDTAESGVLCPGGQAAGDDLQPRKREPPRPRRTRNSASVGSHHQLQGRPAALLHRGRSGERLSAFALDGECGYTRARPGAPERGARPLRHRRHPGAHGAAAVQHLRHGAPHRVPAGHPHRAGRDAERGPAPAQVRGSELLRVRAGLMSGPGLRAVVLRAAPRGQAACDLHLPGLVPRRRLRARGPIQALLVQQPGPGAIPGRVLRRHALHPVAPAPPSGAPRSGRAAGLRLRRQLHRGADPRRRPLCPRRGRRAPVARGDRHPPGAPPGPGVRPREGVPAALAGNGLPIPL
ncbi:MAG: hypothetical protein AVDCRST_MAG89-4835, partial [uncultured Gemmatimonadetes bacterium]